MSGTVARRNQPCWWALPVRWVQLKRAKASACDDCVLNQHETPGTSVRIDRAVWRRRSGTGENEQVTDLCGTHRQEWLTWTPGQLLLGETP